MKEGIVKRGFGGREVKEREERGGVEAEERIGLVGPVEVARSAGVARGEGVLGAFVVGIGLLEFLLL